MHIAAQPVEFSNDDWRALVVGVLDAPGGLECRPQLRPTPRVAFAGLNLDKAGDDIEALGLAEAADCLALRFEPEARTALLLGADPEAGSFARSGFSALALVYAIGCGAAWAAGPNGTIGAAMPNTKGEWYTPQLYGITDEAKKFGYDVIIQDAAFSQARH